MLLLAAIILTVSQVVVANPQHCYSCSGTFDCPYWPFWRNQTCDQYSLGTSHCGTAAIRYRESRFSEVVTTFKGCFDCTDKKAACFALAGYLGLNVLKCDLDCCNEANCNNNVTKQLTQKAIDVHVDVLQTKVPTPSVCYACDDNDDTTCTLNQQQQTCSSFLGPYLGQTHCSSAKLKVSNNINGLEEIRFVRGCIDCQDKKSACDLLAGNLKARGMTLLECEIDCCNNGSFCNDGAAYRPKCWSCTLEGAGSDCSAGQQRQICDIDPESLGTTHCGSAAGRKRNQIGVIQNFFYRGCFDCAKKREACFALGGYWKGNVDNRGATTLLECDLECCDVSGINGSYCNVHTPELKPAAVTVFTPTVTGPAQCNVCLERNATSCTDNQEIQVCGVDPYSLGTTHCGSAVGTYRDSKGDIVPGFFRGCINCADKKAACAAIGGFRKNVQKWTQLECKIECCTGDNCNTQKPSLLKLKSNKALRTDFHQILLSAVLAFSLAVALNIVN